MKQLLVPSNFFFSLGFLNLIFFNVFKLVYYGPMECYKTKGVFFRCH